MAADRRYLFDMAVSTCRTKIAAAGHYAILAGRRGKLEEALDWLDRAREHCDGSKNAEKILRLLADQISVEWYKKKYGKCICGG